MILAALHKMKSCSSQKKFLRANFEWPYLDLEKSKYNENFLYIRLKTYVSKQTIYTLISSFSDKIPKLKTHGYV